MEVKAGVLNAISQSCNKNSDFSEVKLVPYASLCIKNYLDQFFIKGYGPDVVRLPDGRSEPIFVTYDLCK